MLSLISSTSHFSWSPSLADGTPTCLKEMFINWCLHTGVPVREMILSATPHSSQQRKLVMSKGSSGSDWSQASSITGWRGHSKSRGSAEKTRSWRAADGHAIPGTALRYGRRWRWVAVSSSRHCMFPTPRASAALRAMTVTVQCKADHDGGCEVQDDSNVRQPGPSHHPILTDNALQSGTFQLPMGGGRSNGKLWPGIATSMLISRQKKSQ